MPCHDGLEEPRRRQTTSAAVKFNPPLLVRNVIAQLRDIRVKRRRAKVSNDQSGTHARAMDEMLPIALDVDHDDVVESKSMKQWQVVRRLGPAGCRESERRYIRDHGFR